MVMVFDDPMTTPLREKHPINVETTTKRETNTTV
jgi:hypothetical protein